MAHGEGNPKFGRYVLVSRLGMGGMAEVYKARSLTDPNVTVAIKRILKPFSHDKKLVGMLVNEARLSLGLAHPNIVPVLDFGVVDGDYFIAMEYIKGKDLKSIMIRCKMRNIDLPVPIALRIMIHVLRGLDFAHHKRDHFDQPLEIIHRDISPQNIMISLWGQIKILDFGIAKAASRATDTQAGILKGKFSYMSPEQARGKDVDKRTDIFSAGIVMWELLTLESCFQADTDIKLLEHVRQGKVRNPSSVNPKIPREVEQIVLQALEKKPRKRFQTAGEFARALEGYLTSTFGAVRDADVAAFVRTLFGIPASEWETAGPDQATLISDGIANALSEAVPDSDISLPPPPRPMRQGGIPIQWWGPALVAVTVAMFFWRAPAVALFRWYDGHILRFADQIKRPKVAPATSENPAPDLGVEFRAPADPEPLYSVHWSSDAKMQMENLPFDAFERVRDRATDLGNNPTPAQVEAESQRPGLRSVVQSGWRIHYKIDEQLRIVTISEIQKAKGS